MIIESVPDSTVNDAIVAALGKNPQRWAVAELVLEVLVANDWSVVREITPDELADRVDV
jgi:hypothetical protein